MKTERLELLMLLHNHVITYNNRLYLVKVEPIVYTDTVVVHKPNLINQILGKKSTYREDVTTDVKQVWLLSFREGETRHLAISPNRFIEKYILEGTEKIAYKYQFNRKLVQFADLKRDMEALYELKLKEKHKNIENIKEKDGTTAKPEEQKDKPV